MVVQPRYVDAVFCISLFILHLEPIRKPPLATTELSERVYKFHLGVARLPTPTTPISLALEPQSEFLDALLGDFREIFYH